MRKILNVLLAAMISLVTSLCVVPVYAEEIDDSSSALYSVEVPLDQDYYEGTFYDENGKQVTLIVESLPAVTRVSDGAKRISHNSFGISMAYTISVKNNRIINAYDPQYSFSLSTVDSSSLSFNSSQATLRVALRYSREYTLKSSISNNNLNVIFS